MIRVLEIMLILRAQFHIVKSLKGKKDVFEELKSGF